MVEALKPIKLEKDKSASGDLLFWNFLSEECLDFGKETLTFVSHIIRGNIVISSLKYLD